MAWEPWADLHDPAHHPLGVGATTAIFTVVYATLLAPLPYPQPDQLVNVWSKVQGHRGLVSPGDFFDWKRQSTLFQELNLGGPNNFNLATQDSPEFFDGMEATPGYYECWAPFSWAAIFFPKKVEPGEAHVVILYPPALAAPRRKSEDRRPDGADQRRAS